MNFPGSFKISKRIKGKNGCRTSPINEIIYWIHILNYQYFQIKVLKGTRNSPEY